MRYEITLTTDRDGLTKLLATEIEMAISTVGENDRPPVSLEAVASVHTRKLMAKRGAPIARRNKPSKVDALILEALDEGPRETAELRETLAKNGLSPTSVTKLAALRKAGKIKQDEDGRWTLA